MINFFTIQDIFDKIYSVIYYAIFIFLLSYFQIFANQISTYSFQQAIVPTILLIIVSIIAIIYYQSENYVNDIELNNKITNQSFILISLTLTLTLWIISTFIFPFISHQNACTIIQNNSNIDIQFLTIGFAIPIIEEVIFRGLILDMFNSLCFNKTTNELIDNNLVLMIPSVLISTYLFINSHLHLTIINIVTYTLLSCILMYARIYKKDLKDNIIIHVLWNCLTLTMIM